MNRITVISPVVVLLSALSLCASLILFTSGCGSLSYSGEIHKFEAHPSTICCGTTVTLEWETTSTGVSLSKNPGGDIPGPHNDDQFDEEGEYADVGVCEDTVYTLIAHAQGYGSIDSEQVTVEVVSGDEEHLLGAVGSCKDGEPVWGATIPPDDWDETIRVREVFNESGIDVTVSHAGQSLFIPAGAGGAFNDVTFAGAWQITPADIRASWQQFCSDNPDFEGEEGFLAPVPTVDSPDLPLGSPPAIWLRVTIGCP